LVPTFNHVNPSLSLQSQYPPNIGSNFQPCVSALCKETPSSQVVHK
jgi:hypothetical protein